MANALGMRALLPGDLDFAVRAVLPIAPPDRPAMVRQLIQQARLAEAHRRQTGRAHPKFGTGSLMSAASKWPLTPMPHHCDIGYLAALQTTTQVLIQQLSEGNPDQH